MKSKYEVNFESNFFLKRDFQHGKKNPVIFNKTILRNNISFPMYLEQFFTDVLCERWSEI